MKQWVQKLIDQLDYEPKGSKDTAHADGPAVKLSDDRATLLYLLETYNKNLFEVDTHPLRRVREQLDGFARDLLGQEKPTPEDTLFRIRQFFAQYRTAEYAYVRKSFEDFKGIIWNFVENLTDDTKVEEAEDKQVGQNLLALREAVETDSIDELRAKSKQFMTAYVQHQSKREQRRTQKILGIRKNVDLLRKQLDESERSLRVDHLTQAFNRRSFDERLRLDFSQFALDRKPVTLLTIDIDFFKKINDDYGHDVGDYMLIECVRVLKEAYGRENDFVARVGGEEFSVILAGHTLPSAMLRAEEGLQRIRKEVFVKDTMELRFTVSMGAAQLRERETLEEWTKRADQALYTAKQTGRNRCVAADGPLKNVA